jgi:hypothetical protein
MNSPAKIEGYRRKRIRCFKLILKEWIRATTEITEEWAEYRDVPLWYTERASLSVFAGAVWRAGGLSFEEYSDEKRKVGKRTRRLGALYPGRVDLHFSWRGFDFIAEAKDTWSGFNQEHADPKRRLAGCLRRACSDIKKTAPHGQRRLGIAFAMPYFRKGAKPQIDKKILAWVDALEDLDTSAYAWVFPKSSRYIHDSDGYFCPGVAVLIKEVKR